MTIESLISTYYAKIAHASSQKQYKEVLHLRDEFIQLVKTIPDHDQEIIKHLEKIAENPRLSGVQMWITAAEFHISNDYLTILCKLLEVDDPYVLHERVIEMLYDLANPLAVPSLAKSLAYDYPTDPGRQIAVRALEALKKIGTPEALALIEKSLSSESPEIHYAAASLLGRNEI